MDLSAIIDGISAPTAVAAIDVDTVPDTPAVADADPAEAVALPKQPEKRKPQDLVAVDEPDSGCGETKRKPAVDLPAEPNSAPPLLPPLLPPMPVAVDSPAGTANGVSKQPAQKKRPVAAVAAPAPSKDRKTGSKNPKKKKKSADSDDDSSGSGNDSSDDEDSDDDADDAEDDSDDSSDEEEYTESSSDDDSDDDDDDEEDDADDDSDAAVPATKRQKQLLHTRGKSAGGRAMAAAPGAAAPAVAQETGACAIPRFFGSASTSNMELPQPKLPADCIHSGALSAAAALARRTMVHDLERAIRFSKALGAYATVPSKDQLAAPRAGSGVAFVTITTAFPDVKQIMVTGNGAFDTMMLECKNAAGDTVLIGFLNDVSLAAVSALAAMSKSIGGIMKQDHHALTWVDLAVMILGMAVVTKTGSLDGTRFGIMKHALCYRSQADEEGSYSHQLLTKWWPTKQSSSAAAAAAAKQQKK
jgi:hypothetical protein